MKILTITVPCYNSTEYMDRCIRSLLVGGDDVEILIVDDGSAKDNTFEVAKHYEEAYPGIVRAIHQENKGHGGAVNTGIENATGKYFKVVDSDDKVATLAFSKVIETLKSLEDEGGVDMFLSNYIYDKDGAKKKALMRYQHVLPEGRIFTWDETKKFGPTQYVLMHSIIYRTELLRECGLKLPEHTFYVDNLYAFIPIPFVKKLYYLNVNLYLYYIGREDQSVHESVMIGRLDQQLKVNRLMVDVFAKENVQQPQCYKYMRSYLEMITTISSVILLLDGSDEAKEKTKGLWSYIKEHDPRLYKFFRRSPLLNAVRLPGRGGRQISLLGYHIAQKIFGFN